MLHLEAFKVKGSVEGAAMEVKIEHDGPVVRTSLGEDGGCGLKSCQQKGIQNKETVEAGGWFDVVP
jgi:hypothetical protein